MRKFVLLITLAAAWIISFSPAFAAIDLPCEVEHDLIWLKVAASNGQRLSFILDSGAGCTVVDSRCAAELGLPLGGTFRVQGVECGTSAREAHRFTASLGSVSLPSDVLALDLASLGALCGRQVDGIIGLDFFRQHIVQINYAARRVRLLSPEERPTFGEILSLVPRNDALCVAMEVDGKAGLFRLDTGCASAVQWAGRTVSRKSENGTSIGAAPRTSQYAACDVRLGSNHLPNVPVGLHRAAIFPGESGLLGNRLLNKFTLTIDAASRKMALARTD